ncbi:SURP and G-patch domain-containing protein 2 isoform X2 [Pogona vitticeps]
MASRRMAQDSFDNLVQVKAKRYRMDPSDPLNKALHQLRVHSRPVLQTSYGDEEEDLHDDRKYTQSDWAKESRGDYSAPSYASGSRDLEEGNYYEKSFSQLPSWSRGYLQPSLRERDYPRASSTEIDYGGPSSRDKDYSRLASRDFRSPGLLEEDIGGGPGYDAEYHLAPKRDFGSSLPMARGSGLRGKRAVATHARAPTQGDLASSGKKWVAPSLASAEDVPVDPFEERAISSARLALSLGAQKNLLSPRSLKGAERSQDDMPFLGPVDATDVFSTFGTEIIKWAGFHKVKKDKECLEQFQALFTVETETCAKMLASFKCPLKYEHQQFCLYSMKNIQHLALRKPQVDNTFLNFLMDNKVMETKNAFFEVIGPFDRVLMKLQYYILKSTTPLLMACNTYEFSLRTDSISSLAQMAEAFEATISLCRKSLVLLGQTFALASSERQEKILEALGIQEAAPSPTLFPNFDTSALFGREYIEHLRSWLEKSGYQMRLKSAAPSSPSQSVQETRPKTKAPQRADQKVAATIEKLVNDIVLGVLTERDMSELRSDPEYWFLHEEESLEHKYYKLKLSEMKRLRTEDEKGDEQRVADAVRALIYRKKIASIKKKLFARRKPGILQRAARARRGKKATVGTQTLLSAGTMLKQLPASPPSQEAEGDEAAPPDPLSDAPTPGPEEAQPAGGVMDPKGPSEISQSLECQFPDVDPKTMITAQKLAEFVAEVGPEIEQFSIENSADNPDLWFLQDQKSSAFRFYRLKVYELCPSISFGTGKEASEDHPSPDPAKDPGGTSKEEGGHSEAEGEGGGGTETDVAGSTAGAPPEEGTEAKAEGAGAGGTAGGLSELPARTPARGTPFGRKRVSSKSLKVGLIPASKRVCLIDEPKVHDPVQIAYDRPRGYSSYKNKKPKDLEFQHKRLNQKNIGFQMLQKMGWKEGLGLGTHGDGIKEPVRVGSTSAGEGLGVTGDKKEDTFATFRQRMIQMYYMKRANNFSGSLS